MIATITKTETLLAADPVFPGRDELVNPDALRNHLARATSMEIGACDVLRVKYRPRKSLRVLARADFDGRPQLFSARMFPVGNTVLLRDASAFIDEIATAIWCFPFDRKIDALRKLDMRTRELVAYAPEKCATFCVKSKTGRTIAYQKFFANPAEGQRIFGLYQALQAAPTGCSVPKPVDYSQTEAAITIEAIDGARLYDLNGPRAADAHLMFGEAVARLHDCTVPAALLPFLRHDREKIVQTVQLVAETLPAKLNAAKRTAVNLTSSRADGRQRAVLHGDVHAKNVIVGEDGRVTLIDLDQTSVGDAASDIGSFLAGLHYREITGELGSNDRLLHAYSFLEGYRASRSLPSVERLNQMTATALFTERIARSVSRMRRAGLEKFDELIARADELISGGIQ